MAAVRQELSYHHELRAGAVISVYSRVLEGEGEGDSLFP